MYFQSRYYTVTSQTERACEILQDALDLKLEYLQVGHISLRRSRYHCSCVLLYQSFNIYALSVDVSVAESERL